MKIKNSSFMISAVKSDQYPEGELPEIAFAGKSNVGKSSLINMLLNRRKLAKTSSTPGKTQTINFYNIDDKFRMVDLPGYGYAKVSKSQKAKWGEMIGNYLSGRENLLEVALLVDIRHRVTSDDKMMYNWIKEYGYRGIIIATKADKLSQSGVSKSLKDIKKDLEMDENSVLIAASSEKRTGKYKIWDLFNKLFEEKNLDIFFERQISK